jgi:hypothetical protein
MSHKKLNSASLSNIINEHIDADRRLSLMEKELRNISSIMERYEAGEDVSEEELNELLGGLSAIGKWGKQKAADVASQAWNTAKGAAKDIKHQYDVGQRASAIDKQRKSVDKQQVANNQKVQDLVTKGKELNDTIRAYRKQLADIGVEYKRLTGKEFVPGRAVANAKRYVDESMIDGD